MSAVNETITCLFLVVTVDRSRSALLTNIITSVLNSFLSVTAVCGNSFVIYVIWRQAILHVPSNILLCCLALSDLVVGLISQPSFVIYQVTEFKGYFTDVYCTTKILQSCIGWLTAGVSLLTLCAISVDRYLALKLHMRYAAVVTVARVLATVTAFWLSCTTGIGLRFLMNDENHWNIIPLVIMAVSLFVTILAYTHVCLIVRRHQSQIRDRFELAAHFKGRSAVEIARHKKSAATMLYILGAVIVCYVPFLGTVFSETVRGNTLSVKIAYQYTSTIVFFSSSLNPLLYCWRIREIRRAAIGIISRIREILLGKSLLSVHAQKLN